MLERTVGRDADTGRGVYRDTEAGKVFGQGNGIWCHCDPVEAFSVLCASDGRCRRQLQAATLAAVLCGEMCFLFRAFPAPTLRIEFPWSKRGKE